MHSRLYIHLQPLQAAENSLVAFDPSTQLFMEVVEVPKPFCIRHNFSWWGEMLLSESSSKISRMLASLENNLVGEILPIVICTVGFRLVITNAIMYELNLWILKITTNTITFYFHSVFFSFLFFHYASTHLYINLYTHLTCSWSQAAEAHCSTHCQKLQPGQVTRLTQD